MQDYKLLITMITRQVIMNSQYWPIYSPNIILFTSTFAKFYITVKNNICITGERIQVHLHLLGVNK
jgi:hypothetical protein